MASGIVQGIDLDVRSFAPASWPLRSSICLKTSFETSLVNSLSLEHSFIKAIVSMFSTITWGIGIALLALVSDKIFELAITKAAEKFGVSTKEITEEKTSTKIIEKQPTEPNTSSDTSTS